MKTIGIIAGNGRFPILAAREARREGYKVVVSAIEKEADAGLEKIADAHQWVKIGELKNLSYHELKSRLRMEGDFCIYFEDEKGNIVLINNSYKGIGASNINISGTPCSQ